MIMSEYLGKSKTVPFVAYKCKIFFFLPVTAINSRVPVLFDFSNKKVIFSLNWSKEDMPSAAAREVPMTKQVVEALTGVGGI